MKCSVQNLTVRQHENNRQSNIELLRIVAMILIIAHHFSVHGGFDFSKTAVTIPRLWIQFIQIGGKIGVNVFVLISGYFLIDAREIKVSKIIKLWLQLCFYAWSMYLILVLSGQITFNVNVIKCILPVTAQTWWFASTYIVLYILSPFLNIFLKSLSKQNYQKLLVLLLIMWCIIPTVTNRWLESNSLLWFAFLYAIAAYLQLWHQNALFSCKTYHFLALILTVLTFCSAVFFDILGTRNAFFGTIATYFYDMNTLPILLISIFMLVGFKELQIGYSRIINLISAATFGVYLIHDNPFFRSFLWIDYFKVANYANTVFIIPFSIGVILLIYIVCTCIEIIRIYLVEKQYMRLVTKKESLYQNMINKFFMLNIFNKL